MGHRQTRLRQGALASEAKVDRVLDLSELCVAALMVGGILTRFSARSIALWLTTAICAICLFTLGYVEWRSLASKETPLGAYAMLAVVPAVVVAAVESMLMRSRLSFLSRALIGSIVWLAVAIVSLVVGLALNLPG